jgi:hypothetical protein
MSQVLIKLDPRQFAILRHVFVLSQEEQELLDKYFLRTGKASNFLLAVEEEHDSGQDTILHQGIRYQVMWEDTSYAFLDDRWTKFKKDTPLLLSFRVNYMNSFACVLVKKIAKEYEHKYTKTPDWTWC